MISKSVSLAIALLTLVGLAAPTGVMLQTAQAQLGEEIANSVLDSVFGDGDNEDNDEEAAAAEEVEEEAGDDNQDIDQTQEQTNEQDQDAEQEVDQESSQDETNIQANELDTGDNTATVAQSNDADQDVAAEAEAEASDQEDSDSTDADATAEATGIVDQDNTADVDQDSSIHDVDLSNNIAFGDDTNTQITVPIIDQDQRAANLAEQRAANLDLDIVRVQQPTPTPTTQPPEEEEEEEQPPEEGVSFCFAIIGETTPPRCFDTELQCIIARGNEVPPPGTEFTPCVEVGPG